MAGNNMPPISKDKLTEMNGMGLVSVAQAARIAKCSTQKISQWLDDGLITGAMSGDVEFINKASLLAHIELKTIDNSRRAS